MPDEDMAAKVAEVQRVAAEAEAEAVSENGAVRVVAGPAGQIKLLDLQLSAFDMSGVELGELLVQTIHAATRNADAAMEAAVNSIFGEVFAGLGEDEGTGDDRPR